MAQDAAAMLRLEAGRNPHDKDLITLIGELSTQSDLFCQHWAADPDTPTADNLTLLATWAASVTAS
jgi:hypothetical protein